MCLRQWTQSRPRFTILRAPAPLLPYWVQGTTHLHNPNTSTTHFYTGDSRNMFLRNVDSTPHTRCQHLHIAPTSKLNHCEGLKSVTSCSAIEEFLVMLKQILNRVEGYGLDVAGSGRRPEMASVESNKNAQKIRSDQKLRKKKSVPRGASEGITRTSDIGTWHNFITYTQFLHIWTQQCSSSKAILFQKHPLPFHTASKWRFFDSQSNYLTMLFKLHVLQHWTVLRCYQKGNTKIAKNLSVQSLYISKFKCSISKLQIIRLAKQVNK